MDAIPKPPSRCPAKRSSDGERQASRLADQGIVDGAIGELTLEALDQSTLDLTLGSDIVSSLSRLLAFVEGPDNTLPYEIYGVVTLDRRLRQLPFSARGLVPLAAAAER